MLVIAFDQSLLFEACMNPNFETLKKILDTFKFDLYSVDALRFRPIDHLIGHGDKTTLDLFVSRGIDIFSPNFLGYSPLYLACIMENPETAQYLIERGANPS